MNIPEIIRPVAFSDREILDEAAFDRDLAASGNPGKLFRQTLSRGDARLRELFEAGLTAAELVPARARLIDRLLVRAWRRHMDGAAEDVALVAVGGYGRGELHPCSDIDVMILLTSEAGIKHYGPDIEAFLTFLWDMGVEVGHSVRTLADCMRESEADVTVVTNLMEARLLAGPQDLLAAMSAAIAPDRVWPSDTFFEAKRREQERRHAKFDDTACNLEPNIKEGPGGLRDIQTVAWVAKRHFGARTLHDLVEKGFLTEAEHEELLRGQTFLWRIRFALHAMTGRRQDRLLFDYQRQLAQAFGYQDGPNNLAIEQFMQRYYRTIMALGRLNEMLLQLFEEAILLADDPQLPGPINSRFQARNGFIEARNPRVFVRYPYALLEIFLLFAQHRELKGFRAATIRLIRQHRHLIDKRFREDLRARTLFMELLRQPRGITHAFRRMNAYGVLAAYLPEFGRIVGRMQYDLFHVYTVDQHILFVLRNLRRFYLPEFAHEMPHCNEVMATLPKPELIYIAGLYHDMAKGRGGDHSELGAEEVERFCQRHELSRYDTHLVSWLVRHHLLMSLTSQKQDISDPEVIHAFGLKVTDQTHLNYLYLLTVADIRGTNPELWNSWKQTLLRQLYDATRRVLRRGLENPLDKEELITGTQARAAKLLLRQGIDLITARRVWSDFSEDYFLRHTEDEIAWHTRAVLKKADDDRSLVLSRQHPGGTAVFVYTRGRGHVFATTTWLFELMGLTVVDARILTAHSGHTLDTYIVLDESGARITDRARIRTLVRRLRAELARRHDTVQENHRRAPRQLRYFRTRTQVHFSADEANGRTVLELIAADRPGLLSRVAKAFLKCQVRVQNAKIATLGERAEDVFFITDTHNRPLTDPARREELREALLRELGAECS